MIVASGCEKKKSWACPRYVPVFTHVEMTSSPVVATVNGTPIRSDRVANRMRDFDETAKEAVQALIDEELLVGEAMRRGIHREPETLDSAKQLAIYALIRSTFEREVTRKSIPEDQIRRVYLAERLKRFDRPELRRFSHIFVRRPWFRRNKRWVIDAKRDAEAKALAEKLLDHAQQVQPKTWKEFERLADRVRGQGFKVRTERGTQARFQLRKVFADQLFGMIAPGDITGVIKTKPGYHVVFLVKIMPPLKVPYAEARKQVIEKVFPLMRRKLFREWVQDLRKRCPITERPEHLPVQGAPGGEGP